MYSQTISTGSPRLKIQLSKGYFVDFSRLSRLLKEVRNDGRRRVPQADLSAAVGYAQAHVENLCSIAIALGLLEKVTYNLTILGRLIQQHDQFFDEVGTLWFLHYTVGSEPRYLIWNRIVAEILPNRQPITRDAIREEFNSLSPWVSEQSIRKHVLKEVNSVLDAYTKQQFARLNYLRFDGRRYQIGLSEPVPPLVLAASIVLFRDRQRPGDTAVSVQDLLAAPNSPGMVFGLDETRLRGSLEQLKMQPGISLESRADLDQVRLTDDRSAAGWMERYYASR